MCTLTICMASSSSNNLFWFSLLAASICFVATHCQLSPNYYSSTCPKVLPIIKKTLIAAINKETRIGASLLRLHFHDCFVNGCDGSVLLDDTASFTGEKTALPNNNSIRGFDVVDQIKAKLEKACPGVVSCADILAVVAHDSVVYIVSDLVTDERVLRLQLGGPSWTTVLGRRDSLTANLMAANSDIPAPTSNIRTLVTRFAAKGLSAKDMVALSGSHTIGLARCTSFRGRIYNDSNINAAFAKFLKQRCPRSGKDNKLARLDAATPKHFDNCYYRNLLNSKGLLHSDQVLYNGSFTDSQVKSYVNKPLAFFRDFAIAMVKMGNISPLTGNQGEIRVNCRKVN